MKRIIIVLVAVLMILPLGSCGSEFSFRGSRFGDSMEQVKQAEGDGGESGEFEGYRELRFQKELYSGYTGSLDYYFKDDGLQLIIGMFSNYGDDNKEHIEDVYHNIKETFKKYGKPVKEESLEYSFYQVLWENDGYGIFLNVLQNDIIIICSLDPARTNRFYSSYLLTELFSDSGIPDAGKHVPGPDFYNDAYEISSFIPVPKEGYEYTVKNSISEEELSILKDKPSMQQLISAFGYPPLSQIYNNPVTDNGKIKYVKEYYLRYLAGNRLFSVEYDENCNFIKTDYYLGLSGIPEASDSMSFEKPISIVRNDITRDELSFITSDTTPEELQSILGAPHRECYNGELFRRVSFRFIRFFISGHFLYPLKDGGILDVRYSKGKDRNRLDVSTADIYEDNGEITTLVDYEL